MQEIFVPLMHDSITWKSKKKLVLLDEHFFAGENKALLENIEYDLINDADLNLLNANEVETISKEVCKALTPLLNEYHKTQFTEWYWYGLLCRWLRQVVYDISERYEKIKYINTHYCENNVEFQSVSISGDVIPSSFESFYDDSLNGDIYYLSSYNYLLQDVVNQSSDNAYKFHASYYKETKEHENAVSKLIRHIGQYGWKPVLKTIYGMIHNKIVNSRNHMVAEIIISGTDFSSDMIQKIISMSYGRIRRVEFNFEYPNVHTKDSDFRNELLVSLIKNISGRYDCLRVVCEYVAQYMPYAYIEDYEYLSKQIPDEFFNKKIKCILTTTGLWHSPLLFAGLKAKELNNTELRAIQHGGMVHVKYGEYFDSVWDDVFYVWGNVVFDNERSNAISRVAPTAKFNYYRNNRYNGKSTSGILFVGTSCFAKQRQYFYFKNDSTRLYIKRQIEIIKRINPEIRREMIIRNYYKDHGWHINEVLKEEFDDLNYEESYQAGSFPKALMKCKLMVVDHLSTTWAEALYINKPFVIIMDFDNYIFNKAEYKYMLMLQSVGIIRNIDTVEEINHIYKNIDAWWTDKKRQKILNEVRNRYLYNQDLSVSQIAEWWVNELSDI